MDAAAIRKLLENSLSHHQSGRWVEAEAGYVRVLADQPKHADALHLLGVLCGQLGRFDRAIDLLNQSIAANPNAADYHSDLAKMCRKAGRIDAAIAAFENACRLNPGRAEYYLHLGNLFLHQRENQRAVAAFHKCVKISPNFIEAWTNLGIAHSQLGQLTQAITAFQQTVQIKPDYAGGYYNLAKALGDSGQLEMAIENYRKALRLDPKSILALNNLGMALYVQGRLDEAREVLRQALAVKADFAPAYTNLGSVLRDQMQLDAAVAAFRQAVQLAPDNYAAWNDLGAALQELALLDEALDAFDHAIVLKPDDPAVLSSRICSAMFHPGFDADSLLKEQRRWNSNCGQSAARRHHHDNNRDPHRRLRIGYVSGDFREHVIGLNVLPLLREHDRESFEVFAYSDVRRPDHVTEKFRSLSDGWRSIVGVKDEQIAEMVVSDKIDLLVDLSLHLARNRLPVFALKPAPVQIAFAGYPGGTGLSAMDYRLTDPYLDPPGETDAFFVERSIRLPHSFWCFDPAAMMLGLPAVPAVSDLPALANGYVTFGCLNNFCKVNDGVVDLWARVLLETKHSRLLMLAPACSCRDRTLGRFEQAGVETSRIEFVGFQNRDAYLNTFNRIDLGLDTFPYNGHTTSLDSLWMGVPVITCIGRTAVGRAGFSQLSNLRLTELAAKNPDQFVTIAIQLASDLPRLGNLRMTLRQRMLDSPLTDSTTFTRGIEAAYRDGWRAWCADRASLEFRRKIRAKIAKEPTIRPI